MPPRPVVVTVSSRYVVAVGADVGDDEADRLLGALGDIDGVRLVGHWGRRALIDAASHGLDVVRCRVGETARIERVVDHRPS